MAGGMDPLHQFKVTEIFPIHIDTGAAVPLNLSFTNSALFMVLSIALITLLMVVGTRKKALVPGRFQSMAELSYELVAATMRDTVGSEGRKFFPFIFSLFMFVMLANLLGMMPYSFTVTSHVVVTFALALFVFLGVTLVGFYKHGFKFLKLFVPEGCPGALLPFIVAIEVFSYFTRPISLSVRLAANMTAGHVLLKVLAVFVFWMGAWGAFPLLFMAVFVGFEIFVAILQAYIFTILTCVYLNDAIHLH